VVESTKQTAIIFSTSSAFFCPRLSHLKDQQQPENPSSSWSLPAVAVKNAKLYFNKDRHADAFSYTFMIRPSSTASRTRYHLSFKFLRGRTGEIETQQNLTCKALWKNLQSHLQIDYIALWLSPDGSTRLSFEEVDNIAARISAKGHDLLAPLEIAVKETFDALLGSQEVDGDKLANISLDVLEKYESQKQPWTESKVIGSVMDRPAGMCLVSASHHHLGKPYEKEMNTHRAVIALGSNVGDRAELIQKSIQAMRRRGIVVKATSFLYETKAMYYEDQDAFLNGVCEVCLLLFVLGARLLITETG
jgi:hypothetical protein